MFPQAGRELGELCAVSAQGLGFGALPGPWLLTLGLCPPGAFCPWIILENSPAVMSQIKTAVLSLWVEGALPGYVSPKAAVPWRQPVFLCWTQGEPRPCCLWSQFSSGQFQVTE